VLGKRFGSEETAGLWRAAKRVLRRHLGKKGERGAEEMAGLQRALELSAARTQSMLACLQ
jgi:hypothetical protein